MTSYSCYFAADIYTISRGSRKHSAVSATPHRTGASPPASDPNWSWKQFPLSKDHFISTYMHYIFIYALYIYIYTAPGGLWVFHGSELLGFPGFMLLVEPCYLKPTARKKKACGGLLLPQEKPSRLENYNRMLKWGLYSSWDEQEKCKTRKQTTHRSSKLGRRHKEVAGAPASRKSSRKKADSELLDATQHFYRA